MFETKFICLKINKGTMLKPEKKFDNIFFK